MNTEENKPRKRQRLSGSLRALKKVRKHTEAILGRLDSFIAALPSIASRRTNKIHPIVKERNEIAKTLLEVTRQIEEIEARSTGSIPKTSLIGAALRANGGNSE